MWVKNNRRILSLANPADLGKALGLFLHESERTIPASWWMSKRQSGFVNVNPVFWHGVELSVCCVVAAEVVCSIAAPGPQSTGKIHQVFVLLFHAKPQGISHAQYLTPRV